MLWTSKEQLVTYGEDEEIIVGWGLFFDTAFKSLFILLQHDMRIVRCYVVKITCAVSSKYNHICTAQSTIWLNRVLWHGGAFALLYIIKPHFHPYYKKNGMNEQQPHKNKASVPISKNVYVAKKLHTGTFVVRQLYKHSCST